jgi:hypothetical protein
VESNVQKVTDDGSTVVTNNDTLHWFTTAQGQSYLEKSIIQDGQGRTYLLGGNAATAGTLYWYTPAQGLTWVASNVQSISTDGAGHVFARMTDGSIDLCTNGQTTRGTVAADGSVYFLQADGELDRLSGGQNFSVLSTDVQSFSFGSGGMLNLILKPATLRSATAGQEYTAEIQPTAASGSSSFALAPGAPTWLHLTSAGILSGTTTSARTSSFTVQVTNTSATGFTATQTCTLTVNPGPMYGITVSAPASIGSGSSFTVTVTGTDLYGNTANYSGPVTLRYAASSGGRVSLPSFIQLTNGTGSFTVLANHSGEVTLIALADSAISGSIGANSSITIYPTLFTYTFMEYAYDSNGNLMHYKDGNPIETSFVIRAYNDTQASGILSNFVDGWRQQLDDNHIDWSTIYRVLESKIAAN